MQKVRIILTLITIITIVGPIAAELVLYRNDLTGLIIPPDLLSLINGNGTNETGIIGQPIKLPQLVNADYDPTTRTVSFSFNFTNPFKLNLTLNSMTANVECAQHNFALGNMALANPVLLGPNETVLIPVTGSWTEEAMEHFKNEHAGATTIDVYLTELNVDVSGISLKLPDKYPVKNVPLTG
jgi:hypothetical protein